VTQPARPVLRPNGITITERDFGLVSIEAYVDVPGLSSYRKRIFDGWQRSDNVCEVTYRIGEDKIKLPNVQVGTDAEAREYLTRLAELTLAANQKKRARK
jgi:hypothetical protein